MKLHHISSHGVLCLACWKYLTHILLLLLSASCLAWCFFRSFMCVRLASNMRIWPSHHLQMASHYCQNKFPISCRCLYWPCSISSHAHASSPLFLLFLDIWFRCCFLQKDFDRKVGQLSWLCVKGSHPSIYWMMPHLSSFYLNTACNRM